ncbi:MAG: hypothetical protein ACOVS5_01790 [Oligoflexus sp.]|jgi:hypothetical protein
MVGHQNPDRIDHHKSWVKSFPVGSKLFRGHTVLTVLSAGIDFLVLKREQDGGLEKVFRNTLESQEYSASRRVV